MSSSCPNNGYHGMVYLEAVRKFREDWLGGLLKEHKTVRQTAKAAMSNRTYIHKVLNELDVDLSKAYQCGTCKNCAPYRGLSLVIATHQFKVTWLQALMKSHKTASAAARSAGINRTHLHKLLLNFEIATPKPQHRGKWGDLSDRTPHPSQLPKPNLILQQARARV